MKRSGASATIDLCRIDQSIPGRINSWVLPSPSGRLWHVQSHDAVRVAQSGHAVANKHLDDDSERTCAPRHPASATAPNGRHKRAPSERRQYRLRSASHRYQVAVSGCGQTEADTVFGENTTSRNPTEKRERTRTVVRVPSHSY